MFKLLILSLISAFTISAFGSSEYIETSLQRDGMKACKRGFIMTGIDVKNYKLLCSSHYGPGYSNLEGKFKNPKRFFKQINGCPAGYAMTGYNKKTYEMLCIPAFSNYASSTSTNKGIIIDPLWTMKWRRPTVRNNIHACPRGTLMTGLRWSKGDRAYSRLACMSSSKVRETEAIVTGWTYASCPVGSFIRSMTTYKSRYSGSNTRPLFTCVLPKDWRARYAKDEVSSTTTIHNGTWDECKEGYAMTGVNHTYSGNDNFKHYLCAPYHVSARTRKYTTRTYRWGLIACERGIVVGFDRKTGDIKCTIGIDVNASYSANAK